MTETSRAAWAQDAFYRSQVISDAEIAWRVLRDADENGFRLTTQQALDEAHSILKMLRPPTSALMERSGWGADRHHALVRYAYARAAANWNIRKVWVDLELPVLTDERKQPPSSPKLTSTPWGRLPEPDIFLEATDESRIWIECQTVQSWRGLTDKARAAQVFGDQNAYTHFVIVGVSPDDRYLAEVRNAVEGCRKAFEHWDPVNQPVANIEEDAAKLIRQEVRPSPPSRGPLSGADRYWAWRGGSNRNPAVIAQDVPLKVPPTFQGGHSFVTAAWPRSCSNCDGSGSAPGDVREACPRCGRNGLVPAGARDWKLCPRCWASQTLSTEPCARCQGRGWTMDEGSIVTNIGIPSPSEPAEFREREISLYPDKLRSRKLVLRVHISFEGQETNG
jgi:hypothetical protein